MADSRNYLFVAALNLCHEYSGYSFSVYDDPRNLENPLKILTSTWQTGYRQYTSSKTPTCLLLNGQREFVAFGYEAESQWAELVLDNEHDDYYYFDESTISLIYNKNFRNGTMIHDITGKKQLPAFDVFRLSIKYLMNHLQDVLIRRGTIPQYDEIRWVLIIPENFSERAKRSLRSCAEATYNVDSFIFALEPETISIFCQYLSTNMTRTKSEVIMYMVVDLGGDTADITVYQRAANGNFKEKHRDSENNCGGTSIDHRFFKLLEEIFGRTIMKSLKTKCPLTYIDLIRELKLMKGTVDTTAKTKVTLSIPCVELDKLCQEVHSKNLETLLENCLYAKDVKLMHDKIRISDEIFEKLCMPSIDGVISLMRDMFRKVTPKDLLHVFIIGGFSKNLIFENTVRNAFPDKRVIIPVEEDGLAILKGAVLIGQRQDFIQYRGLRYSYGVKTNVPWKENKYDRKYYVLMEGEERCDNIFSIVFGKDESVEAGMLVKKSFFTPYKHQDKMDIMVYVSEETTPEYVDDAKCFLLCTSTITFPETCEDRRWVDVEFILGNTKFDLRARDRKSGKVISSDFNLIQ